MSSAPERPRYMPGDLVELDVEIAHEMNVESVEVRFKPEDDEGANLLLTAGVPGPSPQQPTSGRKRWSTARTSGEVSREHAPGVYNLLTIIVNTAGGWSHRLEDDELRMGLFGITSLEVVEESGKPEIISGGLVQ